MRFVRRFSCLLFRSSFSGDRTACSEFFYVHTLVNWGVTFDNDNDNDRCSLVRVCCECNVTKGVARRRNVAEAIINEANDQTI